MATKIIAILLVTILGTVKEVYGVETGHDWSISAIAYGPFTAGACVTFYLVGKLYCLRWLELRGTGNIQMLLETLFVPATAVLIPLGFLRWAYTPVPWIAAVVAIFLLNDSNKAVRSFLQEKAPLHDSEHWLYLRFPPRDGIDMLPLDVIFILFIGVGCVALGAA